MSESGEAAGEPLEAAGELREAAGDEFSPPPSAAGRLRAFRAAIVQFCGRSGGKGSSGSR
eukprot:2650960-Pleurochrysis_carterae.AAC.1